MSEALPDPVITHTDLLVEIKVMMNDVSHIRKELDRITQVNNLEIAKLEKKHDEAIAALNAKIEPIKTRVDQGVVISGLLALVLPILIGLMFNGDKSEPLRESDQPSLSRQ